MEFDETAYRSFRKELYRHARNRLGDHFASEDVVQDCFLRVAQYRPGSIANMGALLRRIANNLIVDQTRFRRRRAEDVPAQDFEVPDDEPSHEQVLLHRERMEQVSQILDRMPPQRREVFVMRRLHGMSAKEVGAALKISPAAVDAHVARAVLALHKEMAALEGR
ncbi:RNA polymerase sigma factor [Novosphingobium beihaiensis]|uniref:RNA polymerase sigma factor n=1 Tax=Novosphingobium beihaiensis TaxID=2930389 RepID=A0ABT0BL52_9SPHN|nr:RNA polymerase sigma factor [Novosphingobium beihaiensis]MCJ2185780.1 RNA polymerase sigma factor [Novosphingobium beihaiensis]